MSKVMVVEDDAALREIYGIRITAEGYDVVSAGDGEEALAVAVREKPDLILSDVMMPKISGFDMLDILRATPETAGIKVIMMTALSGEDQRQRGERLGADRYLVKSQVGIEDVINTIHEVLGDRGTPASGSSPAGATSAPSLNQAPATSQTAQGMTKATQASSSPDHTPNPVNTNPAQPFQTQPAQAPAAPSNPAQSNNVAPNYGQPTNPAQ
jgi:DNA-binding response OmpR family regulator